MHVDSSVCLCCADPDVRVDMETFLNTVVPEVNRQCVMFLQELHISLPHGACSLGF
jgi:thiamine phosphate synthase YjbQ (UPF0047 family)